MITKVVNVQTSKKYILLSIAVLTILFTQIPASVVFADKEVGSKYAIPLVSGVITNNTADNSGSGEAIQNVMITDSTVSGAVATETGIRKFVGSSAGVGSANMNNRGQYISFAVQETLPVTTTTLPATAAAQPAVDLGTAGNFVILAKSGISTTGSTTIVGDIGVSPIDSTAITGFGLIMDSSNQFATSSLVNGKAYAADYSPPTPTTMTTAVSDMEAAYTDAAGRALPDQTDLGAGNIGGMTLAPGLYKWGTDVEIPTDVTLSGGVNDVWIFQIAGNLVISSGKQVILSGGAQAKNIFWQVAGQTTLGTTSVFNGNILDQTAIVLNTGATLYGRALAQTAVTSDANHIAAAYEVINPTTTTTLTPETTSTTVPVTTTTTTLINTTTTTAITTTTTSMPTTTLFATTTTSTTLPVTTTTLFNTTTTSTSLPETTTTTSIPSTTTTLVTSVPEFDSAAVPLLVLLLMPAVAYAMIRTKRA